MAKIALIGDSHAKSVFKTLEPLLYEKGFAVSYSRAENGWSLKKHISEGSLEKIKAAKPDTILVSLGGNNHVLNEAQYKTTVDKLITLAKNIGANIVWVGPTTSNPAVAPNTERRHAWTENFLSQYIPKHGKYISMRAFTSQGQGKDGVHYPWKFYNKWARFVNKRVELPFLERYPQATAAAFAVGASLILLGVGWTVSRIVGKEGSTAYKDHKHLHDLRLRPIVYSNIERITAVQEKMK